MLDFPLLPPPPAASLSFPAPVMFVTLDLRHDLLASIVDILRNKNKITIYEWLRDSCNTRQRSNIWEQN
jgi:hypothetical protein